MNVTLNQNKKKKNMTKNIMNVRNCTVRTMCEKRKMTIAGELDAKKRVTEKQAQKYGCRFVYAVIEYNEMKKDGIYKPFK